MVWPVPFAFAGTPVPQIPPTDSNGVVEVSTPEQLVYIDEHQSIYASKTIELMSNIDMSELNGGQPYTNWQPNIRAGAGLMNVYVNGVLVQKVNGRFAADPSTEKDTTYMPIWYVEQLLNRLGFQSKWNGTMWTVSTGAQN